MLMTKTGIAIDGRDPAERNNHTYNANLTESKMSMILYSNGDFDTKSSPQSKALAELRQRIPLCFDSANPNSAASDWQAFRNLLESPEFDLWPTIKQIRAIESFGMLACMKSYTLELRRDLYCTVCDSKKHQKYERTDSWPSILSALSILSLSRPIVEKEQLRVSLLLALRRILSHYLPPSIEGDDTVFKWCTSMFRSTSRDCRIAASRVLPFFTLDHDAILTLTSSNQYRVFDVVKRAESTYDGCLTEATIMAWGQIARLSEGDDLNFTLMRLIISLGSDNTFSAAMTFRELKSLAVCRGVSPWRLLAPFWSSISVFVLKEFGLKSRVLQSLSDLLDVSIDNFLIRTQEYTVPYLILSRKSTILQHIADIEGRDMFELCMANMYSILAVLLTQEFSDLLREPMNFLMEVSEKFSRLTLTSLIRTDLIAIAVEVLKTYSKDDFDRPESEIASYKAISLIADQDVKSSTSRSQLTNLGSFFNKNILGMLTRFSDMLYSVHKKLQWTEKVRCLRGIAASIRFAKSHAVAAKPQICACLLSALEDPALQEEALQVWTTMVRYFGASEVIKLLPLTISVVFNYWEQLSLKSRSVAQMMLLLVANTVPNNITNVRVSQITTKEDIIPELRDVMHGIISKLEPASSDEDVAVDITSRCAHENFCVVHEALLELRHFLLSKQYSLSTVLRGSLRVGLYRYLLNLCQRCSESRPYIARLAAECIGWIGAVDHGRLVEPQNKDQLVLCNFQSKEENIDFVLYFLDKYVVPSFRSSTDTKAQLFLAYAMQQLLKYCDLNTASLTLAGGAKNYQKWINLSEASKVTLTPFLTSRYDLSSGLSGKRKYPIFAKSPDHRTWLQAFTLDLLCRLSIIFKPLRSKNSIDLFFVLSKIINNQDSSIAQFLLPFMVQQVIAMGSDEDRRAIMNELLSVLKTDARSDEYSRDDIKLSYHTVFTILDYSGQWQRVRRKQITATKSSKARKRTGERPLETHEIVDLDNEDVIAETEHLMNEIPIEIVASRAFELQSYARALLYYEQYLRASQTNGESKQKDDIYRKLQQIYIKLNDPDAIQGISTLLLSSDLEQQIAEHEAAGRWDLAKNCYEIDIQEQATNAELQTRWLFCLRELDQYGSLLNRLNTIYNKQDTCKEMIDLAIESSWILNNWESLDRWILRASKPTFEYSIGKALTCIRSGDILELYKTISDARTEIANEISMSGSLSPKISHEFMFRLHALADIETLVMQSLRPQSDYSLLSDYLQRRTEFLGGSYRETRYLLDLRKAVAGLVRTKFSKDEDLTAWLQKAKLARKSGKYDQAYTSVLNASKHGSPLADIEHARIQWNQGHRRQAMRKLGLVVNSNSLDKVGALNTTTDVALTTGSNTNPVMPRNVIKAKALLLYAKWFDQSNEANWASVIQRYKAVTKHCETFESGHYYIGRYYVKILDAQKAIPQQQQQTKAFLTGEYHRSIVRSYTKALSSGVKHIYQTLPKLLTIWLDFASEQFKYYGTGNESKDVMSSRARHLSNMTTTIRSCFRTLPKYLFFTVLAQMISRICLDNTDVNEVLSATIVSVAVEYPSQALWQILAISKSVDTERAAKGRDILMKIKLSIASRNDPSSSDILKRAASLTGALVTFCHAVSKAHGEVDIRVLGDLNQLLPCELVVPVQANMTINWPIKWSGAEDYMAFSRRVTIYSIDPIVHVMNSLQKPKRIKIYGSDGSEHFILCKPKDDLRKDARMMEFNSMINMLLGKNNDASQRNLLIMTYAVTVLNEDAGLIEWVSDTKTLRDIIRMAYSARNIQIDFVELRELLSASKKSSVRRENFEHQVLPKFPPVLYEWFIDTFPTPTSWLESRTAFARTTAVMSIVGYVLGLGDRHCENILLHGGTGNALHVDFSCLFEKGLDLIVPEVVPFRLTHNMTDALGPYGYDGPLRCCCEITLRILRENEEFLLPVLETFLHDPLVEWLSATKKKGKHGAASSPEEALSRIYQRLRGVLVNDSFPLSVEAQTDSLLVTATDNAKLAEMYVGWCAFW